MTRLTRCRHCKADLSLIFADLGATPVSNDFLGPEQRFGAEPYYPLRAFVCQTCRLVQLEDFRRSSDLFREDYAYFSSISSTWLEHARRYADAMSERYGLQPGSTIVEVASNDGYLLQYFVKPKSYSACSASNRRLNRLQKLRCKEKVHPDRRVEFLRRKETGRTNQLARARLCR